MPTTAMLHGAPGLDVSATNPLSTLMFSSKYANAPRCKRSSKPSSLNEVSDDNANSKVTFDHCYRLRRHRDLERGDTIDNFDGLPGSLQF